jgi:hypothetical protein
MRILAATVFAGMLFASPGQSIAAARSPGDPVRLVWTEGDVAGTSTIYDPEGRREIGFIDYRQRRDGDRLTSVRVARFRDGSSDEDSAEARVGDVLEAISGRSIMRNASGEVVVDITIDVAAGRIVAAWGTGSDRQTMDEHAALPKGTYWGPLIFIVLKNFDANAADDRVVFRTVAPTPRPMVIDMELTRGPTATLERVGLRVETRRYELTPTIHWALDPIVRLIAPDATFFMMPGEPPSLARFRGPRNYARQGIMIE